MTKQDILEYFKDINEVYNNPNKHDDLSKMLDMLVSCSEKPNKTGTWRKDIDNSRRWDRVRFYCSECGGWQTYGETDFCPSCGAKMEEREKK